MFYCYVICFWVEWLIKHKNVTSLFVGWLGPPGISEDTDTSQVWINTLKCIWYWTVLCTTELWCVCMQFVTIKQINVQLVKESSDEQEALQALCYQQNPADPCAWFPEGKTQGKFYQAGILCKCWQTRVNYVVLWDIWLLASLEWPFTLFVGLAWGVSHVKQGGNHNGD